MNDFATQTTDLHQNSFVLDAHCDTLGHATAYIYSRRDLTEWGERGHLDLPRMRAGGINAQIFACFPGVERLSANATSGALQRVEALYDLIKRAPDQVTLVQTADDLARLTPDGPIGGILGLEGVEALDGQMSLFRIFQRLGVRNIGLTWDPRNAAADGAGAGTSFGLTPFGRELVEACNEMGVMVDVSHLNAAGLEDVLAISNKPFIASHSNARALFDHPRNLTDAQIRAIADKGGVIGATFVTFFLTAHPEQATLDDLLNHIDHLVNVGGIEHVGIGSDYDGCTTPPELDSGEKYPALTAGLLRRGYAPDDIRKILGENFRRAFMEVLPQK
jgi:membrane dipeptidase